LSDASAREIRNPSPDHSAPASAPMSFRRDPSTRFSIMPRFSFDRPARLQYCERLG
jgi:hypothetical protein